MLKGLFTSTVGVKHRVDDSRDRNNEYQFNPPIDVPCSVKTPYRKRMKISDEEYIRVDKMVIVDADEEILETDKFVLDAYVYEIAEGGLENLQDVLVTGAIEGYQIALVRERKHNEHEATIGEVSGRRELQQG